jgi:pimeloyl-ACP methyl ester carboxylesterase
MQVELVRTQTADGVRLDGALHAADSARRHDRLDAMVCLSGVGSNFYGSRLIDHIAKCMNDVGIAALSVNTRGHDGISTAATNFGTKRQGAAYEVVDDCRCDVTAWVNFLVERGLERVGLLGHSLGAIKVLYSQAYEPHRSVDSIIAVSPPRLSCSQFKDSSLSASFLSSLSRAQALVDNEQPSELFSATFPFPLIISAATYVDKYGPEERYNILRFAHRIRSSLTFIYGGRELNEGNPAFVDLQRELDALPWLSRPAVSIVEGADHFYSGHVTQLLEQLVASLGS